MDEHRQQKERTMLTDRIAVVCGDLARPYDFTLGLIDLASSPLETRLSVAHRGWARQRWPKPTRC